MDQNEQACGSGGVNAATSFRKDAFGRVKSVTESSLDVTSYGYDVNSKLVSVAQDGPGGQTRTFGYDTAGFLETTPEKGQSPATPTTTSATSSRRRKAGS